MTGVRCAAFVILGAVWLTPMHGAGQSGTDSGGADLAKDVVQSVVANEMKMDANDHSRWMYRDANRENGKSIVKLVVQTAEGDISKTIEIDGHSLTPQQEKIDQQKMHRFATDPAVRAKQKQNAQHDDKQAASLTRILPEAFLWTKVAESGDETTFAFQPNPKFNPPTRQARVFSAMKGTMVVNTTQKRIQSLQGTLIRNVNFGWGLLGKLQKGGTFHVERTNIGGNVWDITQTHVHIHGHALIFKSISEDQDEVTSHYKPAPESITLAEAAKMLNDGEVAKEIGIEQAR